MYRLTINVPVIAPSRRKSKTRAISVVHHTVMTSSDLSEIQFFQNNLRPLYPTAVLEEKVWRPIEDPQDIQIEQVFDCVERTVNRAEEIVAETSFDTYGYQLVRGVED